MSLFWPTLVNRVALPRQVVKKLLSVIVCLRRAAAHARRPPAAAAGARAPRATACPARARPPNLCVACSCSILGLLFFIEPTLKDIVEIISAIQIQGYAVGWHAPSHTLLLLSVL